ncbi:MAG: AmmeMemoRadiSam system protein B [Polyangiaceae bacterium]|nr:AmmeMemoRadiSam system protein B [Polyangiaceae bacterium]
MDARARRVTVGLAFVLAIAVVASTVVLRGRGAGIVAAALSSGVAGQVLPAAGDGALATAGISGAIREPAVADRFYRGDSAALAADVDRYLGQAKERALPELRALIVPHAGYVFSGPVAGEGFRQLRGRAYETVFVLAPSHHAAFRGVSVGDYSAYRTPLGLVRVAALARALPGVDPFTWVPDAELQEHALEVQLPFLQRTLADFALVPLLFGAVDPARVARALAPRLDRDTLVVASSDLSHYHPYDEAVALDRATLDGIVALDVDRVGEESACGRLPIMTVIHLARQLGWRAELLDYRNSGDTSGNRLRVVGYGAVAFVARG